MKAKLLLSMFALCFLCSGCGLCHNLWRTSFVQPKQYQVYFDAKRQRHQFRKLAKVELEKARAIARAESDNYVCEPFSIDEESGFEAGFVDYLMYGGNGNPPALPPRPYWKSNHPNGYQASQDWFKGFQHGAAVAQASGYRACVTVQLSDVLMEGKLPLYMGQMSDIGLAEPIASARGETDGQRPSGLLARESELPVFQPASSETDGQRPSGLLAHDSELPVFQPASSDESPAASADMPENRQLSPPVGQDAVFNSSDSFGSDTSIGTRSQSWSAIQPASFERQPPSPAIRDLPGLERLPSLRGHQNAPIQRLRPVPESDLFEQEQTAPFKSLPPMPDTVMFEQEQSSANKIDQASMGWPSRASKSSANASVSSPAASERVSSLGSEADAGDDVIPNVALASFTEVERVSKEKTTGQSKPNSPIQRRRPFLAVNLLLLAGILTAFRRRRKSTVPANRQYHVHIKPSAFVQLLKTTIQKRQ